MEIRVRTGNIIQNISILNTYLHHMQYNQDELDKYWADIENAFKHIHNNLVNLRRTDNNGQIAKNELIHNCIGAGE